MGLGSEWLYDTQFERDNAALTIREYAFGQMNMLRMLGDEDAANNLKEAINMAIAALRGPQPDPITGLVPCGCGGQGLFEGAYLDEEVPSSYRGSLSCIECGISTIAYEYEQEAVKAWNTAMGWKGVRNDLHKWQ